MSETRDPATWPTPEQFVAEWDQHAGTYADQLHLAKRLIAGAQTIERLRQWKSEATEVIFGLQDLGKALRLPLGMSITGRAAAEAAERWVARAERAEQECRDRDATEADVRARLADAEKALARVREVANDLWRGGCDCGHRADLHTERDGCIGGLALCSCGRSWSGITTDRLRAALDGGR